METSKKIKAGVALGHNLGQIRSNVAYEKSKETDIVIGFFFVFYMGKTPFKASGCISTWADESGTLKQIPHHIIAS